ncbi:hypothetical protein ACFL2H_11710 [Planctomycetota bacterium]
MQFPHQLHTGIIHVASGQSPTMLHLAWHTTLLNETPENRYLWVVPVLEPARLRQVASLCRRIFRKNEQNGLPYGFGIPNDQFDAKTGEYLFKDSQYGLTCASFVLAVFDAAGLQLANYETWPSGREEDTRWQQYILGVLRVTGASEPHIKNIETEVGAVRFQPQQVTACSASESPPVDFDAADEQGEKIRRLVFDQHVEGLFAGLNGHPNVDAAAEAIGKLFKQHAITPLELLADEEALVASYKSEFNRKRILKLRFNAGGIQATVTDNDKQVTAGEFPDDEIGVLESFFERRIEKQGGDNKT